MERVSRTHDELRQASVHVHYELQMMCETARRLEQRPPDYHVKCALMESFTIHARSIHHFLWPWKPKPDDVLACDYVAQESVPPEPSEGSSLSVIRRDVGKYIAHITYARPSAGSEKDWPHTHISSELSGFMKLFQEAVERSDPSLLDDCWRASDTARRVVITQGSLASVHSSSSTSSDSFVIRDLRGVREVDWMPKK